MAQIPLPPAIKIAVWDLQVPSGLNPQGLKAQPGNSLPGEKSNFSKGLLDTAFSPLQRVETHCLVTGKTKKAGAVRPGVLNRPEL
jgi:hypothetical protein